MMVMVMVCSDVIIPGDTTVESKGDAPYKLSHERYAEWCRRWMHHIILIAWSPSVVNRFTLHGWHVPAPSSSPKAKICIVLVHGAGRDRRAFLRVTHTFISLIVWRK
jgi:hypothetical protein